MIVIKVTHHGPKGEFGKREFTQTRDGTHVLQPLWPQILIQSIRFAGKMCQAEIWQAIPIIVTKSNPHAGLRFTCGTERPANFQRRLFESRSLFIDKEKIGRGVVRDIDIGPVVII